MESQPRITRSKTSISYDQLRVTTVQDKITQQFQAAPKKKRQNSLRVAVLKKNYRKRLAEEMNENQRMQAWYSLEEKLKSVDIAMNNPEPVKKADKVRCCLIKPSRFTKDDAATCDDSLASNDSSLLRRTKSFSEKRSNDVHRRPKLEPKQVKKPMFNLDRPAFDLSKPVDLSVANILSKIVPPTPTKQKPEPEPKKKTNFGFSGRSLFPNGKPQKIPKMTENSSTFYLSSSEAASSHSVKVNEMNEKMRYVRQLELEFNENKIKRQRDEEVEKQQKSKRRLSFGRSALHSLVGGRREE